MINVLIVEDNQDKLRKISNILCYSCGIDLQHINHVIDSRSAKLKLKDNFFDLMIIDIAIPNRIDSGINKNAGIDLLNEINSRDLYNIPQHVIAITGYIDVYNDIKSKLDNLMIHILYADISSDEWSERLKTKINSIVCSKKNQNDLIHSYESLLTVVCALESPELDSILANGWHWDKLTFPSDDTVFYSCKLNIKDSIHTIYAAAAPHMGMPFAGVLSMKMINLFKPKYVAMTGITAGLKSKTKLGDIIAADPVWDWGSGKWTESDGKKIFQQEFYQLSLDVGIRNKIKLMAKEIAVLSQIRNSWQGDPPDHELRLLLGPLASGAAVLADSDTVTRILDQHRGLLGIEMETYAVYAAACEAPKPKPMFFSFKSVVDFADGDKNDKYHKYASYTSSQTLKHFVENYLVE